MPLVSCILATRNRPRFLQQAIKYYQRQSLTSSELIIVDDSDQDVRPCIPSNAGIHYVGLRTPTPIGTKLNIGIQRASGTIIQKLDDDDYYHPEFLKHTTSALTTHGGPDAIVAMEAFLVLVLGRDALLRAGGGWYAGATLAFFRQLWERRPFRDVPYREDGFFVDDHPEAARLMLHDPELFVAVRHGKNTWNEIVPEPGVAVAAGPPESVTEFFMHCAPYERSIDDVMGSESAAYYREIAADCNAKPVGA